MARGQQHNNVDCGVYALKFIHHVMFGLPIPTKYAINAVHLRKRLAKILLLKSCLECGQSFL